MHRILALVVLAASACAGGADVPGPEVPLERVRPSEPATEPAPEPAPAVSDDPLDNPEPSMDVTARLVQVGPALAEDGEGGRAESGQAVAIDLRSDGWPGEGMEPSLHVQGLVFRAYTHVDPVTLRFVVAGPERVPEGAVATLRYGDRPVGEVVLPAVEAR